LLEIPEFSYTVNRVYKAIIFFVPKTSLIHLTVSIEHPLVTEKHRATAQTALYAYALRIRRAKKISLSTLLITPLTETNRHTETRHNLAESDVNN